jgi:hypothetical protein
MRTTSRNPEYRFFDFTFACVLYNCWRRRCPESLILWSCLLPAGRSRSIVGSDRWDRPSRESQHPADRAIFRPNAHLYRYPAVEIGNLNA